MTDDAIDDVSLAAEEALVTENETVEVKEISPSEQRQIKLQELAGENNPAAEEEVSGEELAGEEESQGADEPALFSPDQLGYYLNEQNELVTKLKVNGVEREVSAEQLRAYAQKDLAADQRLQQAADWERRLKAEEEAIKLRSESIESSLSQLPDMGAEDLKKAATAIVGKIFDGDEDDAAEELASLMSQRQTPTATPEQIGQIVESKISQKDKESAEAVWQASLQEGVKVLNDDYTDLMGDEVLYNEIDRLTKLMNDARLAGDSDFKDKTAKQILVAAANQTRSWWDEKIGAKTNSTVREANKEQLVKVPKGGSQVFKKPDAVVLDTSPAAVIGRMKNSRATY